MLTYCLSTADCDNHLYSLHATFLVLVKMRVFGIEAADCIFSMDATPAKSTCVPYHDECKVLTRKCVVKATYTYRIALDGANRIKDVRPIQAAGNDFGIYQLQRFTNCCLNLGRCSGSQSHKWRICDCPQPSNFGE